MGMVLDKTGTKQLVMEIIESDMGKIKAELSTDKYDKIRFSTNENPPYDSKKLPSFSFNIFKDTIDKSVVNYLNKQFRDVLEDFTITIGSKTSTGSKSNNPPSQSKEEKVEFQESQFLKIKNLRFDRRLENHYLESHAD